MHRYKVVIVPQAQRQIEGIHNHIFSTLRSPKAAEAVEGAIIEAIMGLSAFPERGHLREVGPFADGRHRTIRAKNYIIVYKVEGGTVYVMAVRYAASTF